MEDNLNNTMDKIQHMLEDEKTLENIKTLINVLSNNSSDNSSEHSPSEKQTTNAEEENIKPSVPVKEILPITETKPNMEIDKQMNTIVKIKKIYDKIANDDDPRINLLNALKPYLNGKRQEKIKNAIKVVQLSKLTTVANEFDDD